MKTALITGASRGIGAGIARALARDGFDLTINYNWSIDAGKLVAEETGGKAVRADVSDPEQVRLMFDEAGALDVLVCNAGISQYGLFSETDFASWRRVFAVNVDGVYNCIKAALPGMLQKGGGAIVIVSSVWGLEGAACETAYSASKAALIGLTKALSKELGRSGIRVNCVCPGVIDTDMLSGFSPEDRRDLVERTPLGRLGTPEDVAELVAFLCSDRASFITGEVISVSGGFAL
jgi:3-oxoacyl-[acyl-carrier protein] reductase